MSKIIDGFRRCCNSISCAPSHVIILPPLTIFYNRVHNKISSVFQSTRSVFGTWELETANLASMAKPVSIEVWNPNGKYRVVSTKPMPGTRWINLLIEQDCRVEVVTLFHFFSLFRFLYWILHVNFDQNLFFFFSNFRYAPRRKLYSLLKISLLWLVTSAMESLDRYFIFHNQVIFFFNE